MNMNDSNKHFVSYNANIFSKSSTSSGAMKPVALYEWGEVMHHPGMLTAFSHNNNSPVVIMITPDTIAYQEIKVGY